jgi:HD superfamily phosphohydrolase
MDKRKIINDPVFGYHQPADWFSVRGVPTPLPAQLTSIKQLGNVILCLPGRPT